MKVKMDSAKRIWCGLIWLMAAGALFGCGGVTIPAGKPCSARGECPAGFVCSASKTCLRPDAGTVIDGGKDAPLDRPVDSSQPDDTGSGVLPEVPSCSAGQHLCPVGCVSDDSPQTCGASCTPCPDPSNGGTAICKSGKCDGTCPTGKKLCFGACIDSAVACSGMCPEGTHLCGQSCPNAMDVNACGTSCDPCPVPANATNATCDGTKCGFTCKSGYHVCGKACPAATDPMACGDACMVCPTDPNGTAICAGGLCSIQCKASYHLCGNKCVSNNDLGSCGPSSCDACQNITGGTATCDGQKCGGMCPTGQMLCNGACIPAGQVCGGCPTGTHNCNGVCVDSKSVNSCGTMCSACSKPNGANQTTCDGSTCDFTCSNGYHKCGTTSCAANDDATACGSSCTKCPTDPNGAATCQQNGTCSLSCNTGYHLCNNRCVSTNDLNNCGASSCGVTCMAPTGGTVSCDGVSCLPVCTNPNQYVCNGVCIDKNMACNGQCMGNNHNCNGFCRANDTMNCGVTCQQCAVPPANGQATCNGTGCGIACNANFRNCPNTNLCVATAAPACCANSDCTAGPTGTIGVCSNNSCTYPCNTPSFKVCGNACIPSGNCCTSGDCPANKPICSNSTCVAKPLGQGCSSGTECANGNCVDGVCCSTSSCPAADACHVGQCQSGTGMCVSTAKTGGSCNDNDSCTQNDTCQAGVCKGTALACASGQRCSAGSCVCDSTSCAAPKCCSNNQCLTQLTCYRDSDHDGYGDPNQNQQGCQATCPSGWVTNGTDCYDLNADAHPGAPYPDVPDGTNRGDGSYDYNCDGVIEFQVKQQFTCELINGSCQLTGPMLSTCTPGGGCTQCFHTISKNACVPLPDGSAGCYDDGSGPDFFQRCR